MNDLLKKALALYNDGDFRMAIACEIHYEEACFYGYRGSYLKYVWDCAYSMAREMERSDYYAF